MADDTPADVSINSALTANKIPRELYSVPLHALQHDTRMRLTIFLDVPGDGDWRYVAQATGLDIRIIDFIETKSEKTREVLSRYIKKGVEATVGSFYEILQNLGRFDVIVETASFVDRDAALFQQSSIQDPCVSFNAENEMLTTGELDLDGVEFFDAFVSYHPQDIKFVTDVLLDQLENSDEFKLCLTDRNVLVGHLMHQSIAKIIDTRCKRVLVLLSRSYVEDQDTLDMLKWELHYSMSINPAARNMVKLIPIIIDPDFKDSSIPDVLRPYAVARYNKPSQTRWFWDRLRRSLAAPTHPDCGYKGPQHKLGVRR